MCWLSRQTSRITQWHDQYITVMSLCDTWCLTWQPVHHSHVTVWYVMSDVTTSTSQSCHCVIRDVWHDNQHITVMSLCDTWCLTWQPKHHSHVTVWYVMSDVTTSTSQSCHCVIRDVWRDNQYITVMSLCDTWCLTWQPVHHSHVTVWYVMSDVTTVMYWLSRQTSRITQWHDCDVLVVTSDITYHTVTWLWCTGCDVRHHVSQTFDDLSLSDTNSLIYKTLTDVLWTIFIRSPRSGIRSLVVFPDYRPRT